MESKAILIALFAVVGLFVVLAVGTLAAFARLELPLGRAAAPRDRGAVVITPDVVVPIEASVRGRDLEDGARARAGGAMDARPPHAR